MTLKELRSKVVLSIEVVEQYYSTIERPQRILSNIWVSQTVVGTKSRKIQYFLCCGLCMEETSNPIHWPLFFFFFEIIITAFFHSLSLIQALTFTTLLQIHGLLFFTNSYRIHACIFKYINIPKYNLLILWNDICMYIFSGITIWH